MHIFTVTFGAKYLTGMVASVPPEETFNLIKKIFIVNLKFTKITSKIPVLRYVTFMSRWSYDIQFHTYAFYINEIVDDKFRPQILSVRTTVNSPLSQFK